MAANLYEAVMTKNATLVKFFDENKEASLLVKKLIGVLANIAHANHVAAEQITYEVFCPKGGDVIVIRLKHPHRSLTT